MTKIKTLTVHFANELERHEIPLFRGAVIATVGRDKDVLFHNHIGDGFRYAYPFIQYKRLKKKATIVAIDNGVDSMSRLLSVDALNVQIGENEIKLEIDSTDIQRTEFEITSEPKKYSIFEWLPLNQNNYRTYIESRNIIERIEMLQRMMTGNIISMAKGLDIHIDKKIELNITEIKELKPIYFKRQKMFVFNATFTANVNLPNNIGLGKGASLGFGTITEIK